MLSRLFVAIKSYESTTKIDFSRFQRFLFVRLAMTGPQASATEEAACASLSPANADVSLARTALTAALSALLSDDMSEEGAERSLLNAAEAIEASVSCSGHHPIMSETLPQRSPNDASLDQVRTRS